jgi:hypothetical protein
MPREQPQSAGPMMKLRFHPQAWQNDYAIDVDAEGLTDWSMPVPPDGAPEDDTYESDEFARAPEAPEWVREWSGPHWVECLNRDELQEAGYAV